MRQKRTSFYVAILLSGVVAVSGCDERVRKKFIREKKQEKRLENLDVVYQPVEYSPEFFDVGEQYEHHFHLWKAWHQDLRQAFESGDSQKRKKYLLGHEIDSIRSMQYWIIPEKKKDFDDMIASLMKIDVELQKPEAMQDERSMVRLLDIVRAKIQGEYDLSHVRDSLIEKP